MFGFGQRDDKSGAALLYIDQVSKMAVDRIQTDSAALRRIRIAFQLSDEPMESGEIALACEYVAKELAELRELKKRGAP